MLQVKRNFKNNSIGFTLVELLVTLSIFTILTGVVLFNQSKFNSTILLTDLAYDTALTVRQAQMYGINIKEFNTGASGDTGNFVPYGVHFATSSPKSFILFADLTYSSSTEGNDGRYGKNTLATIDPSICQIEKGCVSRYSIKRGNYIKQICEEELDVTQKACSTSPDTSKSSLDVVFKRPNPDAQIRFNDSTTVSSVGIATIILGNPDGNIRKVRVRSNGLIEILN